MHLSRGVFAVLLAAILLLIGATVCTAAVLKVGPGETYTTIGSALASAGTNDTIRVKQGTYTENVEITQDGLKLKGSFDTVIDGSSASLACIKITGADHVVIDGLELTGGLDGVEGYNCDDVTIRYCYIHDNTNDGVSLVNCDGWRLHSNAIAGNASWGVTTDTYQVNASGNFWGHASGPGGEGPGSGDTVSANVDYEPWINRNLDAWPAVIIYTATSALPNGAPQTKFGLGATMQYQVGYSILGPDTKYRARGIVTAKFDDDCVKTYKETEKGLKRGPQEMVFSNKTIPFCAPLAETRFIEYRLKLKKNKAGLLSEATALSPIILNPAFGIPPTAGFSADPQSGDAPLTVGFADLSTGTIDTWYWDFDGDDSWDLIEDSPFSSNPFHTYTDPGTYTVKLKVEGPEGENTMQEADYVVVSTPAFVTAAFTANPPFGIAPLTVQFTDLSTGIIDTWQWDFDGNDVIDSTEQNPSHVYNAVGTHEVTLTVSGSGGSATATMNILVFVR